ncbi:MAG: SAM-dependent methyltransferase [Bacteroidales bacterium]|nr:SAM-dependent methyltransferase [Bacteroidales bacterium]
MEKFFEKLDSSLKNNSIIKMTLSKPVSKNNDLRNVYVKPILLKDNKMYQFIYRYERRDETKNFDAVQTMEQVRSLVPTNFQNVSLFTFTEDVTLLVSKKGKPTLMCKKINETREVDLSHDHEKQRLIDPTKPWWNLLGLTSRDGKVMADMQHKFKQICKYVEIVDGVMRQTKFDDEIHIADMGAGKGYLTFALYEYLTTHYDKKIVMEGVEIRPELVEKINEIIRINASLINGRSNMQFIQNSIADYKPSKLDVLIALHACDTATDDAILKGIRNNAKLIICAPCCHKQVRREMEKSGKFDSITKYGIFLERQAVMITDAVRALVLEYCGYKTQVMEFIEIDNTPKNVLLVGRKSEKNVDKEAVARQIKELLDKYGIEEHYLWKNLWKNCRTY